MKNLNLFLGLVVISWLSSYLLKMFVYVNEYYFFALQDKFTTTQIQGFLAHKDRSQLLTLPLIPVLMALKVGVVSVCIMGGLFLFSQEVRWNSLIRIVLYAEFVFILPSLIRLLWFGILNTSYAFEEVNDFTSFSLVELFDRSTIENWLQYPLSVANLFELVYIGLLSYLLSHEMEKPFLFSFKIILSSYGLGLLLWVTAIVFVIVIIS